MHSSIPARATCSAARHSAQCQVIAEHHSILVASAGRGRRARPALISIWRAARWAALAGILGRHYRFQLGSGTQLTVRGLAENHGTGHSNEWTGGCPLHARSNIRKHRLVGANPPRLAECAACDGAQSGPARLRALAAEPPAYTYNPR